MKTITQSDGESDLNPIPVRSASYITGGGPGLVERLESAYKISNIRRLNDPDDHKIKTRNHYDMGE